MVDAGNPKANPSVDLDAAFPPNASASIMETKRFNRGSLIAYSFIGLLIAITLIVSGLVVYLADVDRGMIVKKQITPADRLITEGVIMSLIGATFVQVGAGAILIVQSIFKSDANSASAD